MSHNIFLIGIGGAGMKGLAALLAALGHSIKGTDAQFDTIERDPALRAYKLVPEAQAEPLLKDCDRIIYSDAVPVTHRLRQAALALNIETQPYHKALGAIASQYENVIAVAGTHGKSSTTAFLGHILIEAGLDPAVLLGATVPDWPSGNARLSQSKKIFVVEADEYREHFLTLNPTHLILVSVDWDHPDYFASLDDVVKAYARLMQTLRAPRVVVTNTKTKHKFTNLPWPASTILAKPWPLPLAIPGAHMQANAGLAAAMAAQFGVSSDAAAKALAKFTGLGRRFETLGQLGRMTVISDYGHHPAEIAATLEGAKQKFTGAKILAVIEPHTELRLEKFLPEYAKALTAADGILVAPIYRARQTTPAKHDSRELFSALVAAGCSAWQLDSLDNLKSELEKHSHNFDVAIAFSAGELDHHLRALMSCRT